MRLYALAVILVAVIGFAAAAPVRADVFYLKNGGSVEGALIEQDAENYRVRTTVGIATLPIDTVERIEKKPTILDEYEKRRATLEDTVAAHLALAQWCAEQDYKAGWRTHLRAALKLDPDCAAAHEALGHVKVDGEWVHKRKLEKAAAGKPGETESQSAEDSEENDDKNTALVKAIQSQWFRQIRAIRDQKLNSNDSTAVLDGRDKILAIDDPLAVGPMSRVLGEGNVKMRGVLVEALSRFSNDEATMNLALLAIVDPDDAIRHKALVELKRRDDPRIALQFRKGLFSKNDELVRRAAIAIEVMQDRAAIPDLIELLTAERVKLVEVSTRTFLRGMADAFAISQRYTTADGKVVAYYPNLEITSPGFKSVLIDREYQARQVTVYRTEVLEALRSITGQTFGFDADEWRRWYQEQLP